MKSTQKTIGIDETLWDILDAWLKTDAAKSKGFHSKAQFTTEAVRELLDQHMGSRITYGDLVDVVNQQKQSIDLMKKISVSVEEHIQHVKTLEKFWFKQNFPGIKGGEEE